MIILSTEMCCKGALRLCHCKEKNDCQSAANIIDVAYNIYKERGNREEEGGKWDAAKAKGGEWKNAVKDMFKGKEDDEAKEGKKAS